jgi:hypothetical protein
VVGRFAMGILEWSYGLDHPYRPCVRWLGAIPLLTTRQGAETGMTSGFCSALALLFWVLSAGEEEGANNPRRSQRPEPHSGPYPLRSMT